jgi:hypothetical protein
VFYSDLPPDAQARWTATLCPTTMLSVAAPVGNAGHLYHPMTYLYCTRDAAIPVALQRAMVDRAIDAGADIETITCDAGTCIVGGLVDVADAFMQVIHRS